MRFVLSGRVWHLGAPGVGFLHRCRHSVWSRCGFWFFERSLNYRRCVLSIFRRQIDNSGACAIHAGTVWGALHGLETFSQALRRDGDGGDGDASTVTLACAPLSVSDAPRFPHRGLMVDSARHFLPLTTLKHIVDALEFNKLNVLHWHMVDAEAFPFSAPSSPGLVAGAYAPSLTYSPSDMGSLALYAMERGVRLVTEVGVCCRVLLARSFTFIHRILTRAAAHARCPPCP